MQPWMVHVVAGHHCRRRCRQLDHYDYNLQIFQQDDSHVTTYPNGEWRVAINPNAGVDRSGDDPYKFTVKANQCGEIMCKCPTERALGPEMRWSGGCVDPSEPGCSVNGVDRTDVTWGMLASLSGPTGAGLVQQDIGADSYAQLRSSFRSRRRGRRATDASRFPWQTQVGEVTGPPDGTEATTDALEIPGGMNLVLDRSPGFVFQKLVVMGRLAWDPVANRDVVLEANNILVWGVLEIGTAAAPHPAAWLAEIVLHGTLSRTETLVAAPEHELGSKGIAVFGTMSLHGAETNMTWAVLGRTVEPGDTEVVLAASAGWTTGTAKRIVLTATGYDLDKDELAEVTAVSADGRTLTLAAPAVHRHAVGTPLPAGESGLGAGPGPSTTLAGHVGLLNRNVVVRGAMDPAYWYGGYGGHITVGDTRFETGCQDEHGDDKPAETKTGSLVARSVEFREDRKSVV